MNTLFKKLPGLLIILISSVIFFNACSDDDNNNNVGPINGDGYTLKASYDSIRSFPAGGGIFVVYINPDKDFSGNVDLSIQADPTLNCSLSKTKLTVNDTVAEVMIKPNGNVDLRNFPIKLIATHNGKAKNLDLKVKMYNWQSNYEDAIIKLKEFKNFLLKQNSNYAQIFDNPMMFYATYPEILIVEHYTILTKDYEVRFCYHVMIPPDDWSKICIRERSKVDREIAYIRATDGTVTPMNVADYPTFYGY